MSASPGSFSSVRPLLQKLGFLVMCLPVFVLNTTTKSAYAANAATQTTLDISPTSADRGVPITFSATVKTMSGSAVNPGQVLFCDASAAYCTDDAVLGSAQLSRNGTAAIKLRPSVGDHRIYALFRGTHSYGSSSSSSVALKIAGTFPTSTSLASAGGSGAFTLTSTVMQQPRGLTKPPLTGYVSLYDAAKHAYVRTLPLSKPTYGISVTLKNETLFNYLPVSLVSGDFNNDGFTDLAALGSGSVEVLLGNPTSPGDFLTGDFYAVPNIGSAMVTGDFNGDGLLDLAVSSGTGIDILLGDPANPGRFQAGQFYAAPGNSFLAVGDFNGDGLPDLVLVGGSNGPLTLANVLLNDASHPGQFLPATSYNAGIAGGPVAVADFNGDGLPDIAVACASNPNASPGTIADGMVAILLGDPAHPGHFQTEMLYPSGYSTDSIAVGDFNKDGLPDIAVGNLGRQNIGILLNNLAAPAQFTTEFLSDVNIDPNQTNMVVVGDFNQDGALDVAAGSPTYLGLLLGDPAHPGQFQSEVVECCSGNSEGFSLSAFAAANLDSDEAPVLFATQNAGFSNDFIQTWRSHGTETATATFNNMSVPDVTTIYFRAKYWGALDYESSHSPLVNPNAPTISNIEVTNVTSNSATISWTTNVPTYGVVSYYDYIQPRAYTPWPASPTTRHSVVLTNLDHSSDYQFQISAVIFFPDGTHWTSFSPVEYFLVANL